MMYYTGIGSRKAPTECLELAEKLATFMSKRGYTLRTGDAEGMDRAFCKGSYSSLRQRFSSEDAKPWAFDMVRKYLPEDRSGFDSWKPYVKGLMARNMMQVMGEDGDTPSSLIICYTPVLHYNNSDCGGTGYAIRCALDNDIPVFNMVDPKIMEMLQVWVEEIVG
jgi:hypothetical protein